MKCPMQQITLKSGSTPKDPVVRGTLDFFECITKDCGWWDASWDRCAIISLTRVATELERINEHLREGQL